jgi:hypothetical protein
LATDKSCGGAHGGKDGSGIGDGAGSEDDAQNAQGADADGEQQPDINISSNLEGRAKSEHADRDRSGSVGQERSQPEKQLVRVFWNGPFAGKEFRGFAKGLCCGFGTGALLVWISLQVFHEFAFGKDVVTGDERECYRDDNTAEHLDPRGLQERRNEMNASHGR